MSDGPADTSSYEQDEVVRDPEEAVEATPEGDDDDRITEERPGRR